MGSTQADAGALGVTGQRQGQPPPADALAFGAVAQGADRARAADHRCKLTDDTLRAVIACRQLDALALAFELREADLAAIAFAEQDAA